MTTVPTLDAPATSPLSPGAGPVLVCLPSMSSDTLESTLAVLAATFPSENLFVASPDRSAEEERSASLHLVPYTSGRMQAGWVLSAGDYLAAATLARERNAADVLLLGSEVSSKTPAMIQSMLAELRGGSIDLVTPRPNTAPTEGLVTSALLYPLTRALFGADIRFPLPLDVALSGRMAQRLAAPAQRFATQGANEAIIWPVAEAAVAGFAVRQIDADERLPQPGEQDFNTLFTGVAASLFSDLELKATFWQRARTFASTTRSSAQPAQNVSDTSQEVHSMVDSYRMAYTNLREIWSLVCPPQSLLALKKLSLSPAETFTIKPNLWARIVYDFVLAFHLRTINRSHLLGAFTPLYLAWVGSHLRASGEDDPALAMALVEETAAAFEIEKPYLVSRWRWPDRFNP